MIDFTTIQIFDVAPDIRILKNTNRALLEQNNALENWINIALLGGAIYVAIKLIIFTIKENELSRNKEENQGNN